MANTKLKPKVGEEFTYVMAIELDSLLWTGGIDGLNNIMDNDFHDTFGYGLILTDISYKPVGVDNDKNILLEVSGLVDNIQ